MATSNCLVTNILQNKCYVQQKKEIHAGLEQHEVSIWRNFHFFGELSL